MCRMCVRRAHLDCWGLGERAVELDVRGDDCARRLGAGQRERPGGHALRYIEGVKIPLGLWQGSTENATVATALLSDLVERGLDPEQGCCS
jgi:hypothetical protein